MFFWHLISSPARANMKPYASQVTNSLAKPMFYVVGRRSPYMKLRNYLISVQKINSF